MCAWACVCARAHGYIIKANGRIWYNSYKKVTRMK
nr:MAG TPA: KH domain [Bacteriophage sp.]